MELGTRFVFGNQILEMIVYANLLIWYSSELSLNTFLMYVLPLKSLQCVSKERKETHGVNVYDQI